MESIELQHACANASCSKNDKRYKYSTTVTERTSVPDRWATEGMGVAHKPKNEKIPVQESQDIMGATVETTGKIKLCPSSKTK